MGVGQLMSDCEEAISHQPSDSEHDKVPQGQGIATDTPAALNSTPTAVIVALQVLTIGSPPSTISANMTTSTFPITAQPAAGTLALSQAALAAAAAVTGQPDATAADVTDMLDQSRAFPATAGASDALTAMAAGQQCPGLLQPHLNSRQAQLEASGVEGSSGKSSTPTLSLCSPASSDSSLSLLVDYWSPASPAASANEEEQTELEQAELELADIKQVEIEQAEPEQAETQQAGLELDEIEQAALEQAIELSWLEARGFPEGATGVPEGEQGSTVLAPMYAQAQEPEVNTAGSPADSMSEEEQVQAALKSSLEDVTQQMPLVGPKQPIADLLHASSPKSILQSNMPPVLHVFPRLRRIRGVLPTSHTLSLCMACSPLCNQT